MSEQAVLVDYDPLQEEPRIQPFSVLDSTAADWRARKQAWAALGIRPEVTGRSEDLLYGNQEQLLSYDVACAVCGHKPSKGAPRDKVDGGQDQLFEAPRIAQAYPKAGTACANPRVPHCFGSYKTVERASQQVGALAYGTSIFDPVLCELMYRWYSPRGGIVLDPFAGGAVRGIVAWRLGRRYQGCELRPEQVADNNDQAAAMCAEGTNPPRWHQGDSTELLAPVPPPYPPSSLHIAGPYDMILTCPPYYDLEVYSEDPRDLSYIAKGDIAAARVAYSLILQRAAAMLAPDRYMVVVVGEARDTAVNEYGIVQDTCGALAAAGLHQHAHMILVNAVGTLPLRIAGQWRSSRSPGRRHQHVLVYRKGGAKAAAAAMEPLQLFPEDTGVAD